MHAVNYYPLSYLRVDFYYIEKSMVWLLIVKNKRIFTNLSIIYN